MTTVIESLVPWSGATFSYSKGDLVSVSDAIAAARIAAGLARTGAGYTYQLAGAPVAGTSEVQTLTKSGTLSGGTFKLGFDGEETDAIDYNASAATIVTALEALTGIGSGGVTATGGIISTTAVVVTFAGTLARLAQPLLTLADNSLTGSTPSIGIVETTPGVDATQSGEAAKGALLQDSTNGLLYLNTGTQAQPVWTRIGAHSTELATLEAAIPTAAVADEATADGSDAASTQALANALKAKVNDLLAKLRTAGIITP